MKVQICVVLYWQKDKGIRLTVKGDYQGGNNKRSLR